MRASDEADVAVVAIPPDDVADTATGKDIAGRTVPGTIGSVPARVQVTVWKTVLHDHEVPLSVPGTMPVGRVSVTVTTWLSAEPPAGTVAWKLNVAAPFCVNDPATLFEIAMPRIGPAAAEALIVPATLATAI